VLAAGEDRAADYQVIARRHYDVVNLSMVFAAPLGALSRRLRIGSASPPGWVEFSRWWDELAGGGTDALLGVARVCQAKAAGPVTAPVDGLAREARAALPNIDHEPCWWQRGQVSQNGFAFWETSPDDDRAERQLVVIAPEDQDPQLSAWTWSRGDAAMPPLARYLLHASKLRYQARVRGDGQQISQLLNRVKDRLARLSHLLEAPPGHPDESAALRGLAAEEAELVMTAADVRAMRRTARIAVDNMAAALPEPVGPDRSLAEWLPRQLDDDAEYLAATLHSAQRMRELFTDRRPQNPAPRPAPTPREPATPSETPGRIELRLGFAVDVVGYSARSSPDKESVQERLAALARAVLGELNLDLNETDRQDTGDGMNVFLPATVELHRALPVLIRAWQQRLALDNQRYQDRIRLRMALDVGPVGLTALGFGGKTIITVSRLLHSDTLRRALHEHTNADLAVLVSDQLYQHVVGEGYPGLDATQFQRHLIVVKEYEGHAWLWAAR
jgi:hypothetical protein